MTKKDDASSGDTAPLHGSPGSDELATTPFALQEMFPDAEGLLEVEYATLADIKDNSLIFLDASALLLPYTVGQVTLKKVLDVYKPLAEQKRLIVPGQAAREFVRNRARKVGDIVRHLRDQSSRLSAPFKSHMGFLVDDTDFQALQELSDDVAKLAKEIQKGVEVIVAKISGDVGTDPVSVGYREVLKGCVRDDDRPMGEDTFKKEMLARYAIRRPPGYKDRKKPDGGAGDLLIWQAILNTGEAEKRDCIFVTADTKSDWYTQADGAFQPRIELIEEYRDRSRGQTVHIIPLSTLLELFEAGTEAVSETRSAEQTLSQTATQPTLEDIEARDAEWANLAEEKIRLQSSIKVAEERIRAITQDDYNTSLSLPWNRAVHGSRIELSQMRSRLNEIDKRLLDKSLESWR